MNEKYVNYYDLLDSMGKEKVDSRDAIFEAIERLPKVEAITPDRYKEIVKEETAWMESEEFIDQFVDEHLEDYLHRKGLCTVSPSFLKNLEEEAKMAKAEAHDKGYAEGVKDTEAVYEKYTEVKHGYWVERYKDNYKCSECGSWWACTEEETINVFNYCPKCGAKMDRKAPKVVIKNFEMPKCCDDCFAFDDNGDYPTCRITNWSKGYNWNPRGGRMDNCPLVEVEE